MTRLSRLAATRYLTLYVLFALVGGTALGQARVANYQGLWWGAPAGSQAGWGINIAHQGDVIFATWFTYGPAPFNAPRWYSMTATRTAEGIYSGTLVLTSGSSYAAVPYDPGALKVAPFTGSATLIFDSPTSGTLVYSPTSVEVRQPIVMQAFGPLPTCVWGAMPDLAKATNYTDLWWASPPGTEIGWGVNLTHQGTTIFATWFTYDASGAAMWLSVTAPQTGSATFSGTLYRTTGPSWGTVPFESDLVEYLAVGVATFAFTDGNAGTFVYSVNSQGGAGSSIRIKAITRQIFRPPGTACQ